MNEPKALPSASPLRGEGDGNQQAGEHQTGDRVTYTFHRRDLISPKRGL